MGQLDRVLPPRAPLDVLAQQIVAACGADAWPEDQLFDLVRRAAPYADLERADFDAVVGMLSDGIQTGRGRRGAYLPPRSASTGCSAAGAALASRP
jgi:ATP-dependent Lhr-like helicase